MGRKKSKHRKPKNKKKIPTAVPSSSAPPPIEPSSSPPPSIEPSSSPPPSIEPSSSPPPQIEPSSPAPPWIELPGDVTANILQRLGAVEILESAQKVCTTWRRVCQDPAMWRVIDMKNNGDMQEELPIMCRHAVDRSEGQLIDLSIEYFGDDEMLNYIVERSSNLRRLKLACCYEIYGKALIEAVKKLPQLEELHLIIMPSIFAGDIETIGISCPMLKSFTYNERGCRHPLPEESEDDELMEGPDCNEYALAIAKTMPNLRHLRLFANYMKNEGLQAILDGCPHLESLDLRQCFRVDLGGPLGKRCSQQIKYLKLPYDSVDDYEWDAGESFNGFRELDGGACCFQMVFAACWSFICELSAFLLISILFLQGPRFVESLWLYT